jgi:hypothetical protein
MLLQKLFGRKKPIQRTQPGIRLGRYSDNNKLPSKVKQWTAAEDLFKKEKYLESLDAMFDYLSDEEQQNLFFKRNGSKGSFHFFQGSKVVRGAFDEQALWAEVAVAGMKEPTVPVMRRLLEMNFHLYYSRYALHGDHIVMRFDSSLSTANPNKLYYGLRELAIKADKQDDLLVQEFGNLVATDTDHIIPFTEADKELKIKYLHLWIDKTLDQLQSLDSEKFSGAIAYLILALVFRIDFLISPEGRFMQELEKIPEQYYAQESRPASEKNQLMIDAIHKIRNKPREELLPYLFQSKHTFSIVTPVSHKTVAENIQAALKDMYWYRDNNYPYIANQVMEYALTHAQYQYSLPRPLTLFIQTFMDVNHGDFFEAVGHSPRLYDPKNSQFEKELIIEELKATEQQWKQRYPRLFFNTEELNFSNLLKFNQSFLNVVAALNFDA